MRTLPSENAAELTRQEHRKEIQEGIKMNIWFGEGQQKWPLQGKNKSSKVLNAKRESGKQELKHHPALKVNWGILYCQTISSNKEKQTF